MTTSIPALTRKKVARILASKAKEGGRAGEIMRVESVQLQCCDPAEVSRRCRSPFCPDSLRLEFITPIRAFMMETLGRFRPSSLRRVYLQVPGVVPGDFRFRRCMIQLRSALAVATMVGSPFRRSVLSFAGLVAPSWRVDESTDERGFVIRVRLLCRVDDEIEDGAIDEDWRPLLLRHRVTDIGPWASKKPLVMVHPVRSVLGAIDLVSRAREPLPRNLAEIPVATIIEAFGNARDLFHLYGRRTLSAGRSAMFSSTST